MFETKEQILDQLRAGEDSRAECKEIRFGKSGVLSPNTESFAAGMVAFANVEGGALFLGIKDSGEAAGIPAEKTGVVERWVIDVATNNCDPPIRPGARSVCLPVAGGDVRPILIVTIPRGVFVHQTSAGAYYARVGSTKQRLTSPELARLFQERGRGFVFDEQPVFAADVNELDWKRLETFFGRTPKIPWLDLFRNTRVTTSRLWINWREHRDG